jgi:hypothetical protein
VPRQSSEKTPRDEQRMIFRVPVRELSSVLHCLGLGNGRRKRLPHVKTVGFAKNNSQNGHAH